MRLALVVLLAGCGRVGFDLHDTSSAPRDSAPLPDSGPARVCPGGPMGCGTANQSCCESPIVPGGTFLRSYDQAIDGLFPDASSPATVSAFRLDAFEVTVGRFREFVEANGGTQVAPPANGAGMQANGLGGWDPTWNASLAANRAALETSLNCSSPSPNQASWTATAGANENLAINCITWYEAVAFCVWDGGFLPSEAQWNFAAAGGEEQRAFPWSQPPEALDLDATRANYMCQADGVTGCGNPEPLWNVGLWPLGTGRWGQLDLSGSQWEWTFDTYDPVYATPCTDCEPLTTSDSHISRGGYWGNGGGDNLRAGKRGSHAADSRDYYMGLRCARPL